MSITRTNIFKRNLAILLIVSFVAPYSLLFHEPKKAEAAIPGLAQVCNLVNDAISGAVGALGLGSISDEVPVKPKDLRAKDTCEDVLVSLAVDIALRSVIRSVTNWAASGFPGEGPAFVTNLKRHFYGLQGPVLEKLLNEIKIKDSEGRVLFNFGFFCGPFSNDLSNIFELQLALLKSPTPPDNLSKCTVEHIMSEGGKTLEGFKRDFSQGSWPAWLTIVDGTNNKYGSYFAVKNEFGEREDKKNQDDQRKLIYGQGFFSKILEGECIDEELGVVYTPGWPTDANGVPECKNREPSIIETAGTNINNAVASALNLPNERLALADEIGELIGAFMQGLVIKLFSDGGIFHVNRERPGHEGEPTLFALLETSSTTAEEIWAEQYDTTDQATLQASATERAAEEAEAQRAEDYESCMRIAFKFDETEEVCQEILDEEQAAHDREVQREEAMNDSRTVLDEHADNITGGLDEDSGLDLDGRFDEVNGNLRDIKDGINRLD